MRSLTTSARRAAARLTAARLTVRLVTAIGHGPRGSHLHDDEGAATAEYAVVSVAAAGLGGLLFKLLTSDWFMGLLRQIFESLITTFLQAIGLG